MFATLLESRAARTRRTGGTLLSVTLHAMLIGSAVIVTAQATAPDAETRKVDEIHFTKVETPPPPPPMPSHDQVYTAAPVAKGFHVLIAPIDIPSVMPSVDMSAPPTDENAFSGRGVPGGSPNGVVGGAPAPANGIYSEGQVEKPVAPLPGGHGPLYPDMLRAAGIEGTVLAQFVVDTTGRADIASFTVLRADNALFAAAVRTALPQMRFLPAEVGGHKVRQMVQQPFQFSVTRQ
jgi:protein TonB